MEKLEEEMAVVELKQRSLRKLADELQSPANSILRFTLEWKDLEAHFESMKEGLMKRGRVLAMQERGLVEARERVRVKEVEVEGFLREVREKEGELGLIQGRVLECESELGVKERELGFVRRKVEECTEELEVRERELGFVEKRLSELHVEVAGKEVELDLLTKSVVEQRNELKYRQKEVEGVAKELSDCSEQFESKEKKLNEVMELIGRCIAECKSKQLQLIELETKSTDCFLELDLKEKELSCVRTSIEECVKKLSLKTEELERVSNLVEEQQCELHLKESRLGSVKDLIEELDGKLKKKEAEYVEVLKSVKDKEEQLQSIDKSIEASVKNLELKEAKLSDIKADIDIGSKDLSKIEKFLEDSQSQMNKQNKELEAVKKQKLAMQTSVEDFAYSLQSKDESLGVVGKFLKESLAKFESKVAQLNSIQSKVFECHKRLVAKEQDVDSFKMQLEQRAEEVATEKGKLEKQVKQYQLKEEELDSQRKLLEERLAEVAARNKQLDSSADFLRNKEQLLSTAPSVESCFPGNGGNLQSLLNEHFKKLDSLQTEVLTALQKSPDPAKLVLEGMVGFYPVEGSGEYELSVIRRSCITLLELLSRISPQIKLQVLEASMELARDWRSKLGAAPSNSLEVFGLVKLTSAFRLPLGSRADALDSLFKAVYPNREDHPYEAWQALEFSENLVVSYIISPTVTIDEFGTPIHPSSEVLMSFATLLEDNSQQLLVGEPLPRELLQDKVTTNALRCSPDPAKMVFDLIRKLVVQQGSNCITPRSGSALRYQVLLLQNLMGSPMASAHVEEAAKELAVTWRGSLTLDPLEILAFLLFLAAYGLASYFGEDDVLALAGKITHYKQSPDVWLALGLQVKVPGITSKIVYRKVSTKKV